MRLTATACRLLLFAMTLAAVNANTRIATWGIEPPRILDPNWKIELIRAEPDLVTPVGCCFDDKNRLLVIESHTHFPPDGYEGPKQDRIYLFDDSDGDGVLDRQRLFYEGGTATMGICLLEDGWIAVASRSEVVRIRDSDGDDKADQHELLASLKTEQNYPHNGLTGLVVGPDQWLYFGLGENMGDPYELVAADGSVQVGGGEGGNIFRCRFDGSQLHRHATGLWNPFGLHFDQSDRLWMVGNDPDAMPPCRLLQIVTAGDYGFQFRFGRAGTHPLQSWNGELPGTLPMVAGTGEAPCAVIAVGDRLWVTSWGDNRIETYKLSPKGASWTSQTTVALQGGANFRPVGMALAKDGSIYFTDWVDRSYPVHRKGRLWRLSRVEGSSPITGTLPERNPAELEAEKLESDSSVSIATRIDALQSEDPFIRQAAVAGLVQSGQLSTLVQDPDSSNWKARTSWQKIGLLTALRWQELANPDSVSASTRQQWIEWGLADEDQEVVITALRWATERRLDSLLETVHGLLERPSLSPRTFAGVMASIAYLQSGSAAGGRRDPERERLLYEHAMDDHHSASTRALAIRMLPSEAERPTSQELLDWATKNTDRQLGIEIVRILAQRTDGDSLDALAKIASNDAIPIQTRADATASLAPNAGQYASLLNRLSLPREPKVLQDEVKRLSRQSWSREQGRPAHADLDAWESLVAQGGDAEAGRRVFFRATCSNCHSYQGRGATTGPDLSTLSGQMTARRLMESILQPSKEIGPLYVPWRVVTVDGRTLTGLKLDAPGVGDSVRFQGADGLVFEIPLEEIEQQEPVQQSIMPTGLEEIMSLQELRDLTAFLIGEKP